MNDARVKEFCLSLIKADTEKEIIELLEQAGYWNDKTVWRFYGDSENNFSTIGNQQSRPDAALVEKLVNSIDARLMNECLARGIDAEGTDAPKSIKYAVAQFFENGANPNSVLAGRVSEWPNAKRSEVAKGINVVATGLMPRQGNPSPTFADCGEGQTPEMMPHTLLSLDKGNKLRIPFVQGKFNMGGTGVLEFCGVHNLELIVSRRNPSILNGNFKHESDAQWSFTIVRREDPQGGRRSSVYTYLAPVGAEKKPGKGGVLRFSARDMPIFPEGRNPYARTSEWGTLIKLYEYLLRTKSNIILSRDGVLRRADLLLPEAALPIRFYECRSGYRGAEGSYETTLMGLGIRLEDDRAENLEEPPSSCPIRAGGEHMSASIYAFKKGKAETYRKNEGIIFTINGQTHGHFTSDFFHRRNVGLSYLSDSILVIVNCDKLTGRAREDLFMNSRDRLRNGELRAAIERNLEEMLKNHEGLRALSGLSHKRCPGYKRCRTISRHVENPYRVEGKDGPYAWTCPHLFPGISGRLIARSPTYGPE